MLAVRLLTERGKFAYTVLLERGGCLKVDGKETPRLELESALTQVVLFKVIAHAEYGTEDRKWL